MFENTIRRLDTDSDADADGDKDADALGGSCSPDTFFYPGATIRPNSGFLRVTVSQNEATVEYIRAFLTPEDGENNSVDEAYTVTGTAL